MVSPTTFAIWLVRSSRVRSLAIRFLRSSSVRDIGHLCRLRGCRGRRLIEHDRRPREMQPDVHHRSLSGTYLTMTIALPAVAAAPVCAYETCTCLSVARAPSAAPDGTMFGVKPTAPEVCALTMLVGASP